MKKSRDLFSYKYFSTVPLSEAIGLIEDALRNSDFADELAKEEKKIEAPSNEATRTFFFTWIKDNFANEGGAEAWGRAAEYLSNSTPSLIYPPNSSTTDAWNQIIRLDKPWGERQSILMGQSTSNENKTEPKTSSNAFRDLAVDLLCSLLCSEELDATGVCNDEKVKVPSWMFDYAIEEKLPFLKTGSIRNGKEGNEYKYIKVNYGYLEPYLKSIQKTGDIHLRKPGRPGSDYDQLEKIIKDLLQEDPNRKSLSRILICEMALERYETPPHMHPPEPKTVRGKLKKFLSDLGFK